MTIDINFTSKFIARFEGFVGQIYRDAVGVETVGYGETRADIIERYRSSGISEPEALALLRDRVQQFADAVEASITNRGALTPERHAAFTSLAYNVGVGAFAGSTACSRFNEGNLTGACEAIGWWDKAGGAVLPGLARRRGAEMALFQGDGGLPDPGSPSNQDGTAGSKLIRKGDRGDRVRQAQRSLAGCGITILVDGYYGPISVSIVQTFQRDHGRRPSRPMAWSGRKPGRRCGPRPSPDVAGAGPSASALSIWTSAATRTPVARPWKTSSSATTPSCPGISTTNSDRIRSAAGRVDPGISSSRSTMLRGQIR